MYTGTVEVKGLAELVGRIGELDKVLRQDANTELRQGAKAIGLRVVSRRHELLGGSGIPQDARIVEGARIKYDRFVAVRVPGVKPKLSGLRKASAAEGRSLAVAVEYGSQAPQLQHPPKGALVGRNIARITSAVGDDYKDLLYKVLKRHGLL